MTANLPKYTLETEPTFTLKVKFPRPGSPSIPVKVTVKNRGRIAYAEFLKQTQDMEDEDIFKAIVVGWELDEPFNDENVHILCERFMGVPLATFRAYHAELHGKSVED